MTAAVKGDRHRGLIPDGTNHACCQGPTSRLMPGTTDGAAIDRTTGGAVGAMIGVADADGSEHQLTTDAYAEVGTPFSGTDFALRQDMAYMGW